MRPWVEPGFLARGGDDGGAEGPERGAVGAKRRSAEGASGLGRGAVAPPRYWALGA